MACNTDGTHTVLSMLKNHIELFRRSLRRSFEQHCARVLLLSIHTQMIWLAWSEHWNRSEALWVVNHTPTSLQNTKNSIQPKCPAYKNVNTLFVVLMGNFKRNRRTTSWMAPPVAQPTRAKRKFWKMIFPYLIQPTAAENEIELF